MVTSAVGSRVRWRARTAAGVSPVRDSSVQGMPRSIERRAQRGLGVGGERAERRDPEDAQRRARRRAGRVAGRVSSSQPFESGPIHAASVLPVPVAA